MFYCQYCIDCINIITPNPPINSLAAQVENLLIYLFTPSLSARPIISPEYETEEVSVTGVHTNWRWRVTLYESNSGVTCKERIGVGQCQILAKRRTSN